MSTIPVSPGPQLTIRVHGNDKEEQSFWEWLSREPILRGFVRIKPAPSAEGAMGVPNEIVVVLASTAVSVATGLSQAIRTWLIHRHPTISIELSGPGDSQLSLTAKDVRNSDELAQMIVGMISERPRVIDHQVVSQDQPRGQ